MDEKKNPVQSASEDSAGQGSDLEREADLVKDIENSAGFDSTTKQEASEKAEKYPDNVVDWDGEDDPHCPLNWTTKKKWILGGLLSLMTFITPLASSMFAPSVPQVMKEFKETNSSASSFVVSIFVLGYAFGPLVLAPLSEMYGRSPVYHASNVGFVVSSVCCAVSKNMGMLIAFRFLGGVCGSTPITIGSGTMADLFRSEERGMAMAIWSFGPLLGPVVGPLGGAYLGQAKGWRWDFWVTAMASGAVTLGMLVLVNETYEPILLKRKAERLRKETGNDQLKSKHDHGGTHRELLKVSVVRPLKMLFRSPVIFLLSLYVAIVYGYLYLFFTTITKVFQSTYGFHGGTIGLAFLGIGVGMFVGLFVCGATSDRLVLKLTERNGGVRKPEYRLPLLLPAACIIPIGLFLYGWSTQYAVHWIVPIIGTAFFGAGVITTFMPVMTYLTDSFTKFAASAVAANTVLRSLVGALLPLAGPPMYDALGLGWGNSLLGFIALAMIPVPIIFYKYGERIRTSKRFAVTF